MSPEAFNPFVGKYEFPQFFTISVKHEDNKLIVSVPEGDVVEYYPESDLSFFSLGPYDPPIEFVTKDNSVIEMKIKMDNLLVGKKIE